VNRLAIVAVAAVISVISGVGLLLYVGGAEDRAVESTNPVPVLVTTQEVPAGTTFEAAWNSGAIVEAETPQAMRPDTAVTDPQSLAGTVSDGGMLVGQTVVTGEFVDPSEAGRRTGGFGDRLEDGTVAVSFDAIGADAVGELVQPGDHVNLLVRVENASELGLPDSGGPAVVHVFQDLEILAVGTATGMPEPVADDAAAVPAPPTGSYTVAVAPHDAPRVLFLTREYPALVALTGPNVEPSEIPPVGKPDAIPDTLTALEAVPGLEP
jgi:pilus assembly protein CpaB